MYASQQGAWQNSLETGIFDTLPEILGRWWGIDSTAEAAGNWTTSAKRDSAITGPRCSKPSGSTTGQRQDALFQQRMTSQEDYDKATSQLENLQETFDELLSCGVVASKGRPQRLQRDGLGCRAHCLPGTCLLRDGLPHRRGGLALHRTRRTRWRTRRAGSWSDLAMSYILGRSLWGGKRAYNSVMKTTADVLLSDPKSPWVRYPM